MLGAQKAPMHESEREERREVHKSRKKDLRDGHRRRRPSGDYKTVTSSASGDRHIFEMMLAHYDSTRSEFRDGVFQAGPGRVSWPSLPHEFHRNTQRATRKLCAIRGSHSKLTITYRDDGSPTREKIKKKKAASV